MSARSSINESRALTPLNVVNEDPLARTADQRTPSPDKQTSPHTSVLSSPNASRSSSRTAPDMQSKAAAQIEMDGNDDVDEADTEMDNEDNGSSSLSELEVDDVSDAASDDEPLTTRRDRIPSIHADDIDSEAETEHLEKTPRKPSIIQHDGIAVDRSPSKLSKVLNRDELDQEIAELSSVVEEQLDNSPPSDLLKGLNAGKNGKPSLGKRKRSSSADDRSSEIGEDEPSPKRNHTIDDELQLALLNAEDDVADRTAASEHEQPKDAMPLVDDEHDTHEAADEPVNGAADSEEQALAKTRNHRRGRRKGRRDALAKDDGHPDNSDTPAQDAEEAGEVDEEEEQAREEELARRKLAAVALSQIEKDFQSFREKHLQEQLQQLESEILLLREPDDCSHPDYLARLICVDERRNDKIEHENTLLRYNLQALVTRTIVERGQYLSQYHQEVRAIRDTAINNCYRELFNLQKDRRRFGTEESNIMLFSASKSEQARGQASYNLEVALLSGISANIGFPAAPSISKLSAGELQQDLIVMEINQQPVTSVIRAPSFQDRTIAGDKFLEQTPWANPQHPAHANGPVNNFHTQGLPVTFATPAQQRPYPISANVNGSASTIDMLSNPPSSAAAPPMALIHVPMDSATPVPMSRKDAARVHVAQDANTPAHTHDASRVKNMAPISSPEYARAQYQQHAYPSPSRIAAAAMPIGMANHGDFASVPQRTTMAPVISSGGTMGS